MSGARAWDILPHLPGYEGADAYAALPRYATALHRAVGLASPPFDPRDMAAAIGVAVDEARTPAGNRGVLVPLPSGGYRIIIAADDTPAAQRFTVAHELIELGLQMGCPSLVARSYEDAAASRAKERYCEAGAAEILLPRRHVCRALAAQRAGIAALLPVAQLFGSSLHATLRRIVEVAPYPCLGLILCPREPAGFDPAAEPSREEIELGEIGEMGDAWGATTLRVSTVYQGCEMEGLIAPGARVPWNSALTRAYRERAHLNAVESLVLGSLRGSYRVDALCPGRGAHRHVYALLSPVSTHPMH